MSETQTEVMPAIDTGFMHLLQHHLSGACLTELSKSLREVVEACQLTGKPAGLTLKVAIKPAGNQSGAVVIATDVKSKLPELPKATSFFYSDDKGNLMRNDPNQHELQLTTITSSAGVELEKMRRVN